MTTPNKGKKLDMSGAVMKASPAKTEPLSPMSHTITIEQRDAPRGLFGLTRAKTMVMCAFYVILIGGLAYFIFNWLEIPGLNQQLERLENEVNRLQSENNRFETLNDELNNTVKELDETATFLNISVNELNATVDELSTEVDELKKLNSDLESIAGFLNSTAQDLGESFDQITAFLAEQIDSSKVLTLANLENIMQQRMSSWECNYGARFGTEAFGSNFGLEIPASSWFEVESYVTERVLEEMCLDNADFVRFLQETYSPWNTNNLIAAVSVYTERALDWYFPEVGETGLSHEDWAEATFDCENLTTKFMMYDN